MLSAPAPFAAVANLVPVFCPFLAPGEGALADRAGFFRQVRFFVHEVAMASS